MRVRLEGSLVNTGEGDAGHWIRFSFMRSSGVRLERMGRGLVDYIFLLLTNKVIHSRHGFAATQVYTADQLKVEERSEARCESGYTRDIIVCPRVFRLPRV